MSAEAQTAVDVVRMRNVNKTFSNGTVALRGLNVAIQQGEFVSLLGPSGCGKSTALRLIAGLGEVTSGLIDRPYANGHGGRSIERDIGFVFQEATLMPWATVSDNVFLPLRLAGVSKSDATSHVGEAIEMVGLGGFENAYPRELSGGMRMRVSIARALVTKPKLLLMDEPFAALDEITRFKLNNDLLELWRAQKWTVIFVTHSVYESVYLSSRIIVMAARPGRVVSEITVEEPYPRDDSFRTSTPYNDHCRDVSDKLSDAMRA